MRRPAFIKGAFVLMDPRGSRNQQLTFQFNPETLVRKRNQLNSRSQTVESIQFTLVLDASDGMETENEAVINHGIYPQLAALEELMDDQGGRGDSIIGRLIGHAVHRVVVLVWGDRVVPVRFQKLTIQEQLFNANLKPIHARVGLSLRVLNKTELSGHRAGLQALAAYQNNRRQIAESLGFNED